MNRLKQIIDFIIVNKEFFGILVSFLAFIIPLWQYINSKRQEQRQLNFINFHEKIIRKLGGRREDPSEEIGIEEQVAVIFELRNYSEYYPVTTRILNNCVIRWKESIKDPK